VPVAIVVLVLWLFTAGAGFSVLISSNLKGDQPVGPPELATAIARSPAPLAQTAPSPPAHPGSSAAVPGPAAEPAPQAAHPASATEPGPQAAHPASASAPASRRAAKRALRAQFDPPSLVAARNAPVLPGARSLLEFAHPACGIIGLAFWLGFSLTHTRFLGWIGFGLAAATACAGLTWFAINIRAARRHAQPQDTVPQDTVPQDTAPQDTAPQDTAPPSFHGRLVALHGAAAALTVVLAALTGLVLHG
jgi:hypothetical protein